MGAPAFPRRKSIRQQKEGETAQGSNKVLRVARYPLTARTVEEKDAMPPTNDREGEGLNGKGLQMDFSGSGPLIPLPYGTIERGKGIL
jgi:hypothetical protein